MKIGVISQRDTGVDYHRLLRPFALMQDKHEVIQIKGVGPDVYDYGLDVIVFNRFVPIENQREFLKELKRRGVYVICDVDDYWVLPSNHIALKANKYARKLMLDALTLADEVWTTHELLGGLIENLNPNWHVIPNALDPNEEQWQPKKEYGTRIGWAGSPTHFHDLNLTKDAWGDVIPVICGFAKTKEWIEFSNHFRADYVNALPVDTYGLLYDQFDIAIAPLERNLFTRCKSNLKIIEAGMKGLPIFVENQHPYTDEHTGIFKVDSWSAAITKAKTMESAEIQRMGKALRGYVLENYDLNKVNELRLDRL